MKRRADMEKARKNVMAGPTIRARRDDNDESDSISVSSVSSAHSTLTSSSRLNRLYEAGKQKRLTDLSRSKAGSEEKDNVLDVRKVEPTNVRCDKLYELSKRKHVMGRKRREDIANAKLEAMRALNQMSMDKELSVKKNTTVKRQELSTEWYFSNKSNESESSSDSNAENRYNYEDFILKNYHGNVGSMRSLKQGI